MRAASVSVICFVTMILLVSCGLQRTKMDDWVVKSDERLGISFEMPRDACLPHVSYMDRTGASDGTISFYLHPEYYGYVEPHYAITCYIFVLNEKQFEAFKAKKTKLVFIRDGRYVETIEKVKTNELRPDECYYRRDFRNDSNGCIVIATAIYWESIDPLHKNENVDAIKRILNSIKFIKTLDKKGVGSN